MHTFRTFKTPRITSAPTPVGRRKLTRTNRVIYYPENRWWHTINPFSQLAPRSRTDETAVIHRVLNAQTMQTRILTIPWLTCWFGERLTKSTLRKRSNLSRISTPHSRIGCIRRRRGDAIPWRQLSNIVHNGFLAYNNQYSSFIRKICN